MDCGVGDLDPALLWLWYSPAATAPIGPLTWELHMLQYGLKRQKKVPFPL